MIELARGGAIFHPPLHPFSNPCFYRFEKCEPNVVPWFHFAFYFNEAKGVDFIILQKHLGIALCLWVVAAVLFSRYFLRKESLQETN